MYKAEVMWPALSRALEAVPPTSVDDVRKTFGTDAVALKCFAHGCTSCAEYDVEERHRFEERHLRGARVVPWDCSDTAKRSFVMRHGVRTVPAYLRIDGHKVRVLDPRSQQTE